ncbi:alpha-L-fucosidase [Thermostilla marina]
MSRTRWLTVLLGCSLASALCWGVTAQAEEYYKPDWSSLRRAELPDWLDGMKFGIYCHWGPRTIQNMHLDDDPDMDTLEAIEKWTGEKFSAEEWAELFKAAGAQFAGPVAWHGNGLLNWDSKITDWNSVKHGPKVDIFGELAREIRKRDMKLLSSFHLCEGTAIWGPMSKENPVYLDPRKDNSKWILGPEGRWSRESMIGWAERIEEAIDLYRPDMIWLDVSFGGTVGPELRGHFVEGRLVEGGDNSVGGVPEEFQQRIIAGYFNRAIDWGKEVAVIYKSHDIPPGIGMRDIEDGNLTGLQYDPWMADIDMNLHQHWRSWFYNPKNGIKSTDTLIDTLVDITSKNGRVLLNVPPLPDGSFPPEVRKELLEIGEWLKINGEAIYDTIPWVFYGEGPTTVNHPGHHGQGQNGGRDIPKYTAKDIRFTQKHHFLYAICLDWPGEQMVVRALGWKGKLYPGDIVNVSLLGYDQPVTWKQTAEALIVDMPAEPPCKYAYVLKIERRKAEPLQ